MSFMVSAPLRSVIVAQVHVHGLAVLEAEHHAPVAGDADAPLARAVALQRDLAEQANELGHEDWLALMLDREETVRADKRLANRLQAAKLRFLEACIEDIDFPSGRGLDRRAVLSLAEEPARRGGLRPRSPS